MSQETLNLITLVLLVATGFVAYMLNGVVKSMRDVSDEIKVLITERKAYDVNFTNLQSTVLEVKENQKDGLGRVSQLESDVRMLKSNLDTLNNFASGLGFGRKDVVHMNPLKTSKDT